MEYEKIDQYIKSILSEKRYIHSKGVAKRAKELAHIYGEDEKKAELIGIAHDVAKEMQKEEAIKYVKENGIIFNEIEQKEQGLWHSKIGADIVKKKFGFTKDMSQAILYHTTGNVNMNNMDKIIYIADKTEENRKVKNLILNVEEAIEISNKNLDDGVLYIACNALTYSMNKKSLIHLDTINLINKIIMDSRTLEMFKHKIY